MVHKVPVHGSTVKVRHTKELSAFKKTCIQDQNWFGGVGCRWEDTSQIGDDGGSSVE